MIPRPAATVVLLRPGPTGLEVLLTHRPTTMAFAADMHVFPGGAVDPADGELGGERAFEVAAVRELFEEAGVLLAEPRSGVVSAPASLTAARAALLDGSATIGQVAERLGVKLRTDLLAPLSRWVTPPFVPRRFDVQFFAAQLPGGVEPSFVGDEVLAHRWLTPAAALEAKAAGEIGLWVPTSVTLQQLAHVRDFTEIVDLLAPGMTAAPRIVEEPAGVTRLTLSEAGGVAGQTVNCWVVGEKELLVVDPGDPSGAAVDALLGVATARGGRIVAIVLTSAEPDHAAGAESLAGMIDVPVYAGPGAGRVLSFEVVELGDGAKIPGTDADVTVVEAPGPRADQIALLAGDRFGFVGDLVGPGPSRAIVGPPDVPAWVASLDRLAGLGASRLFPGHGDPLADPGRAIEQRRNELRHHDAARS